MKSPVVPSGLRPDIERAISRGRLTGSAVTIRDIARRVGLSHTSVSNVLNRQGHETAVSPRKAERIRRLAARLGYCVNHTARSLRTGRTATIVVAICGSLKYPYVSELVEAFHHQLSTQGYRLNLELMYPLEQVERIYATLHKGRCDGVVFVRAPANVQAHLLKLKRGGLAVVTTWPTGVAGIDRVDFDGAEASRLAVQHLAEQGHRRIALVVNKVELSPPSARVTGYRDALKGAGLEFDARLVIPWEVDSEADGLWRQLGKVRPRPTAVCTYNEEIALQLIHVVCANGMRVPADLAVVTHGNTRVVRHADVPLTAIDYGYADFARAVVDRLLDRIQHPQEAKSHVILIKPTLIVRQSSGERREP
ncbi:MAG: LacI family DNA-binding transcriptional regulator [Verrucomicrobia bacterium]|nr:LacI family DNA-binding transcriptional regulator [Verrucomicrobiota bacterium]